MTALYICLRVCERLGYKIHEFDALPELTRLQLIHYEMHRQNEEDALLAAQIGGRI